MAGLHEESGQMNSAYRFKRSVVWTVPAIFIWMLCTGMGRSPGTEVPLPGTDIRATIKDDQEISTKVNHASFEGDTFFSGSRGKATVTIAFENAKKAVNAGKSADNKIDFQITLRSGEVVAISINDNAKFSGVTSFGTYRIGASNIKEITFE